MKIYAKQTPPEYQESPLFMGEWPENVFVFGNRRYRQHNGRLEDIRRALEDLCDAWEDITGGAPAYYNSWIDALNDIAPPEGRPDYTRDERKNAWPELLERYCNTYNDAEVFSAALELITGQEWSAATIRGCCQGEWQYIIYPAEYGREWLECFETEYFNTGAEWRVNVDGCDVGIYTHTWSDDGIRAEIASAVGVKPENVILQKFTGWSRAAKYMEV